MKCPRCQQDNPPHARFCLGCGARLALTCASCGAELPGGARFCLQCGQAVTAGTAAPVGSPAPKTYTPKHLAEKILTSKAALEGERKQVTVLFADLKGSMELLADRKALHRSREKQERATTARALRLLGDIAASDATEAEAATRDYGEAAALAAELGMRPLVAHCHLGLGKLYRHTGKRQEAQHHLTTASTMYREMDMRFWLEQAEAEMKECT